MSEEKAPYGLLNSHTKHGTVDAGSTQGAHSSFVDVRTRRGKLIFRLDPLRLLVEWREAKDTELIDLKPLMPE